MIQINLERAVLASYLLIDLTQDEFKINPREKLDPEIFTLPFHKRVAKMINEWIEAKKPLPLLHAILQEKIEGTKYEDYLLLIEATNPLSIDCGLKYYTQLLLQKRVEREFEK